MYKTHLIIAALLACTASINAQDATSSTGKTQLRKGQSSVLVLGAGKDTRAMSPFQNGNNCLLDYAAVANEYYHNFDGKVNVYSMPIPYACEFYGRDVTTGIVRSQVTPFENCFNALDEGVKGVNIIPTLGEHAGEAIYSRTDHHWAALGAYYAAQELARVAGVPFKDLSNYDTKVIHGYVGTMYMYSKVADVKNNPEDFVYHIPQGVEYSTTYIDFSLDKSRRYVVKTGEPHEGKFFWDYPDGSGAAYCTFMGGDTKVTQVKTSTANGRRLLILKDSFGNALPGYLFYSFEQIHVVDCRYFTLNLTQYVNDNGITDIVFANNVGHAATATIIKNYRKYLVQ